MALKIRVAGVTVSVGDSVRIGQAVVEGEKERTQNFEGVVIAIGGNQGERTIMVRRIASAGVGVEKIFPVDLPSIKEVVVLKSAKVRRAKLYFLRDRIGKAALKLEEKKEKEVKKKTVKSKSKKKPVKVD